MALGASPLEDPASGGAVDVLVEQIANGNWQLAKACFSLICVSTFRLMEQAPWFSPDRIFVPRVCGCIWLRTVGVS